MYKKQDRNEITVTTHLPLVNKCLFVSFHVSRYSHEEESKWTTRDVQLRMNKN